MTRIEASGDINSVYDQIDACLKQITEHKMGKQTLLRSTIRRELIREEEAEQERLRILKEEEEAKLKNAEEGEQQDGPQPSVDDNKSKMARSIAQSKASGREGSQFT